MDIWVFAFFIIMNNATVNISVHVFVWPCLQLSWVEETLNETVEKSDE